MIEEMTMKCPICQTEMIVSNLQAVNLTKGPSEKMKIEVGINKYKPRFALKGGTDTLIAYYCPKCGKVELATAPDKEAQNYG